MQPLSEDLQENLDRFIVESLELGCVWGLCDSEGNWAMVSSGEDAEVGVIPFWSDKPLAEQLCVDEWAVYEPVAIAMEEFLDDWLTWVCTKTCIGQGLIGMKILRVKN